MNFTVLVFYASCLILKVVADVSILPLDSEYSGITGDVTIPIQWEESGVFPKLKEFSNYTFTLCSGPNNNITAVQTLGSDIDASTLGNNLYFPTISNTFIGDGFFFIQIVASGSIGYTIHYSDRFRLDSMSGSIEGDKNQQKTKPLPLTIIYSDVTKTTEDYTKFIPSFTIHLYEQTGTVRYASMAKPPDSTIPSYDIDGWKRKHRSTSLSVFKTPGGAAPTVEYTITPVNTYSTIDKTDNSATPAPDPRIIGWHSAGDRKIVPWRSTMNSSSTVKA